MKEFAHLKKLSEIRSNNGIEFLAPAVSPGSHCPMRIASVLSQNIKGLSSLLVGMEECTIHSRLFNPNPEGKNSELHWLYLLDSQEVVFGCREGIIDALRKMDQEGAKHILIITTCIPELIGEDIEGIIYEMNMELSAKITFVMLGQFKNVSYPPGSWKTMESMINFMEEKETNFKQINILGRSPKEDHIPIPQIFNILLKEGINIRYLGPDSSVEDFENSTDSCLNIVISPFALPLAIKMGQEFSIPYIALNKYYNAETIYKNYAEIENKLNISINNHFIEEKKKIDKLEKIAKEKLNDLSFVMGLRIDIPIQLSLYFSQLGMNPKLLHLEEYYETDEQEIYKINKLNYNPYVCRMVNDKEDFSIIEKLSPDLCFGYMPNIKKNYINIDNMYDFYGYIGYERSIKIIEKIFDTLNLDDLKKKKGESDK